MPDKASSWKFVLSLVLLSANAVAQSEHKVQTTLSINGRTGEATTYQADGKTYVDLESLVRIAHGSMSFQGHQIVLHLPQESDSHASSAHESSNTRLSQNFMRSSAQTLTVLKDWTNSLAYGIQNGVPGDGSRMVVFHDRAADALRLAQIDATSNADQDALQLLTNHFNSINAWSDKLIAERKRMDTAKYSITPNALKNDESYQKISSCTKFLSTMLPSGVFHDNYSCR